MTEKPTQDDVAFVIEQCKNALEEERLESDGEWSNYMFPTGAINVCLTTLQQMRTKLWIPVIGNESRHDRTLVIGLRTDGNYEILPVCHLPVRLKSAIRITHWMPLPEHPRQVSNHEPEGTNQEVSAQSANDQSSHGSSVSM